MAVFKGSKEFFPGIGEIKYEGAGSKNPLAFKYYDAEKLIGGKKMKDWLRFAIAYWLSVQTELTSLVPAQGLFHGKIQKKKLMQHLNSLQNLAQNITAGMTATSALKKTALKKA